MRASRTKHRFTEGKGYEYQTTGQYLGPPTGDYTYRSGHEPAHDDKLSEFGRGPGLKADVHFKGALGGHRRWRND